MAKNVQTVCREVKMKSPLGWFIGGYDRHFCKTDRFIYFRSPVGIAEVIPMARGRPWKCPYCGSTQTTCKGVRQTKTQGVRRIRYCTNCKRKFTPKNQKIVEEQQAEKQPENHMSAEERHIEEQAEEHPKEQSTEQPMGL